MARQRLINMDSVIHVVDSFDDTGYNLDTVKRITDGIHAEIEKIQTVDAVEVVRCAKCKHWKYDSGVGMSCMKDVDTFGVGIPKFSYEYCSDGERK